MDDRLQSFIDNIHPSSTVLSYGKATVMEKTVDAVLIRNLYKQEIVWGMFGVSRGKFKGHLANSANTEGVDYEPRP